MRSIFIYTQFLIILLFCAKASAQSALLRGEIEKIIRYEQPIDFNVVPGILIGVIDGDSTFLFQFGRDIDPDGVYELGSLTKPVVAWLGNEALVSLELDRFVSVCAFLPDSLCTGNWKDITYDQVIEHKTGLLRLAPHIGEIESDIKDPYKDYNIALLGRDLKSMTPVPGRYSYSHMGFALTHWLFERVGGLEEFTHEHFTGPFRMPDTRWNYEDNEIAQGHGLDGRPQPAWNTNAFKPALGLKSSMNDMLTFIELLFDGYERNTKMHATSSLKKELKSLSKSGAYKVVDGWFVVRVGNSLVYYHNGRTGGHHVSVAFTPHLRKGVVIIANGAMGSNDLSLLVLRMINQAEKKQKRMTKAKR